MVVDFILAALSLTFAARYWDDAAQQFYVGANTVCFIFCFFEAVRKGRAC